MDAAARRASRLRDAGIIEHEDFCHLCDVSYEDLEDFDAPPQPSMPRNLTMSR